MPTIVIAPNAFKGSLSSTQAATRIAAGLRRAGIHAHFHLIPLADGGDGTLESFLAGGGRRVKVDTVDPLGRPCTADYGLLDGDRTAVIEMALASGLALLKPAEVTPENALRASTEGTGILLQSALDSGARRIIVGGGGSATSDGGMGCLRALGVQFWDREGSPIPPGGDGLNQLAHLDLSGVDARWRGVEIVVASDVTNPALGEQGAVRIFSPQKGADPNAVAQLEAGLNRYFLILHQQLGVDVGSIPGGGAAGAFAAGLMAFLGASIRSGVDLILDQHHFEDHLKDSILVITGEGRIDGQTLEGKGPIGLARRAALQGVQTVALVGGLGIDDQRLHEAGIRVVIPVVDRPMSLQAALDQADELIERAALRLGYCLLLGQSFPPGAI